MRIRLAELKRILAIAGQHGAICSDLAIGVEVISVTLVYGDRTATIKMDPRLEGATPAHLRDLIDWQLEEWKHEPEPQSATS